MRKFIVVLLLCAFAGYVGWRYVTTVATERQSRRASSAVVAVETSRIARADLGDRVVFTGSVAAAEHYDVAPKIPGFIRQIRFNVGDAVRHGDLLVVLDDDEHRLAVEQNEARLQVALASANDAESQLEIAQRDHERVSNLLRERVISSQEFDRTDAVLKAAEAKRDSADAQVKLSEAELRTSQVRLGYARIRAEWNDDGDERVIGQRYMDAGAHVNANTPILSILDIDSVRAIIPVSEKEYPKISTGDRVSVSTDAFPGRTFAGSVSRIPQELGAGTREAEVEVAVDNADRSLKPGMFIRAVIEFRKSDNAAAAPLAAVVRRDDGSRGLYLVNDARDSVAFQTVREGIVDGELVELLDGGSLLGREVVTMGQHLLKDGMAVRVADAKNAGAETAPSAAADANTATPTTAGDA